MTAESILKLYQDVIMKMAEFINPLEIFPDQAKLEKESKERMYPLGIPESKIIAFHKEMNPVSKKNRGGTGMTCLNIYESFERNNSVIVVDFKNDLLV